ncbi:DUF6979 family protein [Anaerobacillus arseniciselenatis]|uniref:DUF6979 family protein n=1 Tax=Anaerobacillus arseniciselenatis TaxID=85682 RepID=UPI003B59451E
MNELWKRVLEGEEKSHNAQMDVVLSLWNNELIKLYPHGVRFFWATLFLAVTYFPILFS